MSSKEADWEVRGDVGARGRQSAHGKAGFEQRSPGGLRTLLKEHTL